MTLYYRHQGHILIVFGNTYPVREQIKALGGTFNGSERNWRMPYSETALELVDQLCRRHGGGVLGMPSGVSAPVLQVPPVQAMSHGRETAGVVSPSDERDQPSSQGGSQVTQGSFAEGGPASGGTDGLGTSAVAESQPSPGMTISELMMRASLVLQRAFPEAIWVTAEVQNLARRPSGIFFDLAEGRDESHANATLTVKAILWRGAAESIAVRRGADALKDVLQDGLKVRMLCRVQLYKDRGQISLLVEDIDPTFTKGALAIAREKLLRELRAKGLDTAQKRLRLVAFPFKVGLISASGSRAQSDFVDQLCSLRFPGQILFCPTPMQGEGVPLQVVAALRYLEKAGCDLIVVTRGGGSAADLRWFDAAEIAYAIAQAKVPIVAAIGHHDDVVVAEEICFQRQKTPTAAADFVAAIFEATRQKIDQLADHLAQDLARRVEEFSVLTASLGERLHGAATKGLGERELTLANRAHGLEREALQVVQRLDLRFQALASSLSLAARDALSKQLDYLSDLERQLTRKDPSPWLEQGWTQLSGPRGMIRRTSDVAEGDDLKARLLDGNIMLRVLKTTEDERSKSRSTPPDGVER